MGTRPIDAARERTDSAFEVASMGMHTAWGIGLALTVTAGCASAPGRALHPRDAEVATALTTFATAVDAEPADLGVECGAETCAPGGVCCGGAHPACVMRADECARARGEGVRGAAASCDGSEDCTGSRVCCVIAERAASSGARCMSGSHCAVYDGGQACHRDADCAPGKACALVDPGGDVFPATLRACR